MLRIFGLILFWITKKIDLRLVLPIIGDRVEKMRSQALKMCGAKIGKNTYIRAGGLVYFPQNLSLGDNTKINNNSSLYLFDKLHIGDDVEIGPDFLVFTGDHYINDPGKPLAKQGTYNIPIIIEDDVYIGARVTILKGAHIESRVVVAAGAVVKGRLQSGYIYGGVPAKRVGKLIQDKVSS